MTALTLGFQIYSIPYRKGIGGVVVTIFVNDHC